jgi:uncharacterized LabA/DUF88 family protein
MILFNAVCAKLELKPIAVRYYTGVPSPQRDAMWSGYWSARLLALSRAGVMVTSRPLKYHDATVPGPSGSAETITTPVEKGIDIRIALDVVRLVLTKQIDVAVIFRQDQDLAEVATEVREIARLQNRWVKVISAYPTSPTATAHRGIEKTDWFQMDKSFYDACLDAKDYRPRS